MVDADTIIQGGNIRLPFGDIVLGVGSTALPSILTGQSYVATGTVELAIGSITSVSGAGALIPYGTTVDGTSWYYGGTSSSNLVTAPPAKEITLTGTAIAIDGGATVDLSGGGDMQASEWVPGTGGSRDVLSNATTLASGESVYAIIPGSSAKTAAIDAAIDSGLSAKQAGTGAYVGEAVTISGVAGLADGVYVLLPASYATLSGAYRVVLNTSVTNPTVTYTQADGTVVASTPLTNALTGAKSSTRYEILVQSGSVWKQYSEYTLSTADSFFPTYAATKGIATPVLPMDAGHLVIGETSTNALTLNGTMVTAPASGGQTAQVDLVSQYIQIVGTDEPALSGYLQVSATALDALDAGSLLIGGVRTTTSSTTSTGATTLGTTITAEANGVMVSNDADSALYAPEILLVATPSGTTAGTGVVIVRSGSVIEAKGSVGTVRGVESFGTALTSSPTTAQVRADLGSLMQVSDGSAITVNMPSAAQLAAASLAGNTYGTVTVEQGASLSAGNSLFIAGTGDTHIALGTNLSAPNITLESSQITFANAGTANLPSVGTIIDPAMLAGIANAQKMIFESNGAIDFLGQDLTLTLASGTLELSAGSFTASTGGTVTIAAPVVQLVNLLGATGSTGVLPETGSLAITAGEVDFGAGAKTIDGFASFTTTATSGIKSQGTGSFGFGAAAVTLNTPVLIADSGSTQTFTTTGALAVNGTAGTPLTNTAIGGAITLTGGSITVTAPILALAGNVTLEATTGDLVLGTGASIDSAAVAKTFYDVTEYANAGAITLKADTGSISVADGVTLDFSSAAAGGGNAGSLTITAASAGKNASIDGAVIKGAAASGTTGGSFSLDVGGAQDMDTLATLLAANGGVTGSVTVHTQAGDLALSQTLTSAAVSLTADGGSVIVTGTIDARGQAGGEIDLYGTGGVDVEGSLLASGSSASQKGGTVVIGTSGTPDGTLNSTFGYENVPSSGAIVVGPNAVIDVSGGSLGGHSGGSITFRAPLLTDGDVNVTISPSAQLVNTVLGGGTATGGVTLDAYVVWSTTDAGGKFDGIVDPAGWYDSTGTLVAGTFTDANGNTVATWDGVSSLTATQIANYLTNDYFTPTTYNAAHAVFYGGYDPNTESFNPSSPDTGSLVDFVQHPGFNFGSRFAGIAITTRPEIDLVNPSTAINSGNISVLTNWNLGAGVLNSDGSITLAYRYNNSIAPVIALRAVNNIEIKASITDGFFQTGSGLLSGYNSEQALINTTNAWLENNYGYTLTSFDPTIYLDDFVTSESIISFDQNESFSQLKKNGTSAYYDAYNTYMVTLYEQWLINLGTWQYYYIAISTPTTSAPVAPSVSDTNYANNYQTYLTAYDSWLKTNFTASNLYTSGTPPAPSAPSTIAQYAAYSTEYLNYYNYIFNSLYDSNTYNTFYTYAPAAPAFQAATNVSAPAGANNPSNMATAANPLPVLSATLMSGQSSTIQIIRPAPTRSRRLDPAMSPSTAISAMSIRRTIWPSCSQPPFAPAAAILTSSLAATSRPWIRRPRPSSIPPVPRWRERPTAPGSASSARPPGRPAHSSITSRTMPSTPMAPATSC